MISSQNPGALQPRACLCVSCSTQSTGAMGRTMLLPRHRAQNVKCALASLCHAQSNVALGSTMLPTGSPGHGFVSLCANHSIVEYCLFKAKGTLPRACMCASFPCSVLHGTGSCYLLGTRDILPWPPSVSLGLARTIMALRRIMLLILEAWDILPKPACVWLCNARSIVVLDRAMLPPRRLGYTIQACMMASLPTSVP